MIVTLDYMDSLWGLALALEYSAPKSDSPEAAERHAAARLFVAVLIDDVSAASVELPESYDEAKAKSEGWVLSERSDGYWEIQTYDEDPRDRFDSDREAHAWVSGEKTQMHRDAVRLDGMRCA